MIKNKGALSLEAYLKQSFAIQVAILVGRILPRKIGLKISSIYGRHMGSDKNSPRVKAIRANQYVIHGESLSNQDLDELPKTIFKSAANCMFDYFYFVSRPRKLKNVFDFKPKAQAAFERTNQNQPTVFVCPHLSNFDLIGYILTLRDYHVQVLSFPEPTVKYQMQNKLRQSLGILVTPMTISAFRSARKRLREGGSVLTGVDRPLPEDQQNKYQPIFFGHEANLPVTYVRMAKEANAPVIVLAPTSQPNGRYQLDASDPIWMESREDLDSEIIHNANRVLAHTEEIIRKYAHQWEMFYPIWPEFLGI